MSKVLTHSNEAGGITLLDNGIKLYWTEGHSDTIVVYPDGNREVVAPHEVEDHPLVDDIVCPDYDEMRAMTPEEEAEYEQVITA